MQNIIFTNICVSIFTFLYNILHNIFKKLNNVNVWDFKIY